MRIINGFCVGEYVGDPTGPAWRDIISVSWRQQAGEQVWEDLERYVDAEVREQVMMAADQQAMLDLNEN